MHQKNTIETYENTDLVLTDNMNDVLIYWVDLVRNMIGDRYLHCWSDAQYILAQYICYLKKANKKILHLIIGTSITEV